MVCRREIASDSIASIPRPRGRAIVTALDRERIPALCGQEAHFLPEDRYDQGYLGELGPSLHSLMQEDLIYKEVHDIPAEQAVDYGVTIDTGVAKVPLGELAVWWQSMEKKYPSKSIDDILAHDEVLQYLNYLGTGKQQHAQNTISSYIVR